MSLDPDWILIEKFYGGDLAAFHEIFFKYKVTVINFAFRVVKQRELAEDIAQEVFIKVYGKKAKPDDKAKFSTWLYRVTVNASLDHVRKKSFSFFSLDQKRESDEGDEVSVLEGIAGDKEASPRKALEERETKALLQKEIEHLPEKLRIPLLLFEYEQKSYRETAQILGTSEKAVERRIYRAKEELRQKLSKSFK